MRDFITLSALVVSMTGIAVSLAREEVRCYLGFNSVTCPPTPELSFPFGGKESEASRRGSDRPTLDLGKSSGSFGVTQPKMVNPSHSAPDQPHNSEPSNAQPPSPLEGAEEPAAGSSLPPEPLSPQNSSLSSENPKNRTPIEDSRPQSPNPPSNFERPIPLPVEPPPADSPQ